VASVSGQPLWTPIGAGLAPTAAELGGLREVASGAAPADLAIRGGRVVFVHTGEVEEADVLVKGRHVAALTPPGVLPQAAEEIDARGLHVLPGLVDSHLHVEYTLLPPGELSRVVVPRGTTAVLADPDCSANALGRRGVELLAGTAAPLRVFLQTTSRVPRFPSLEEGGRALDADEISSLLVSEHSVSLGEGNPYEHSEEMHSLHSLALSAGRRVNGHTARLDGPLLWSYLAAGVGDDHNATTVLEAIERLRRGAAIAIQASSMSDYLSGILAGSEDLGIALSHLMFAADDVVVDDLVDRGHIDHHVRSAIALGVNPSVAVRMASLNAALHFRIDHLVGSLAPTRLADIVLVPDPGVFRPSAVFVGGRLVAADGRPLFDNPDQPYPDDVLGTIRIGRRVRAEDLAVRASGRTRVRVIELVDGYYKRAAEDELTSGTWGSLSPDPFRDIAKVAVVDRHRESGRIGVAFLRGFGLQAGAIAVSTSCESQQIVAVGTSDRECAAAVNALADQGGGYVVTVGGTAVATVPLRYGGIMSVDPYERVVHALRDAKATVRELGCSLPSPFLQLSFVTLASVPELAVTDKGLVDVSSQRPLDVVV
jgi:adenine deaminase